VTFIETSTFGMTDRVNPCDFPVQRGHPGLDRWSGFNLRRWRRACCAAQHSELIFQRVVCKGGLAVTAAW